MKTPSDTPRTDAASWRENNSPRSECVTSDFARTLERELNAAIARATKAEADRYEMRRRWHKSRRACRQQGKALQVQARINTLQSARALLHNKQKQELYEEMRKLKAELKETLARAEKAEAERAENFESLQICAQHCDDARAMVKSLVKERPASVFSTFHCHKCEINEDRLAQTLKALRQLVHEVHAAHRSGLPVAPYCADMLTAIQLLSSIKSPTSES